MVGHTVVDKKVVGGTIKAWLHRQEPESRQDIQYMVVV